jgi:AcrR family transcriptional regulator
LYGKKNYILTSQTDTFERVKKSPIRLSREEWLDKALDILAEEGDAKLRIDSLVRKLDVTKGSFYWHFKNRAEFIVSLVEYWAVKFTKNVGAQISKIDSGAEDRLLALMLLITEKDLSQYSLAVMDWGQHEPLALKRIEEVMNFQMAFVRSLFKEMGFTGDELEMRTQTMVFFQSMEGSRYSHLTKEERTRHVRLRHRMLVAKTV